MNDSADNRWNSDEQLAKNAAEWTAWLEWKRICSVLGCSPNNRSILSRVVFQAFKRKLAKVSCTIHDQWQKEGTLSARRDDFIQEFDVGIEIKKKEGDLAREHAARGEKPRREETLTTSSPYSERRVIVSPKDYKAHAFNLALKQPNDPLRAIRGQLVGELGIINAIVEHYLLYTCGLTLDWIESADENGKKVRSIGFKTVSLTEFEEKGVGNPTQSNDSGAGVSSVYGHITGFNDLAGEFNPEGGDDAPNSGETDPIDSFVNPDSDKTDEDDLVRLREDVRARFSIRQMAVLLAGFRGMAINATSLQKFCGVGHSMLDKTFHSLVVVARDPDTKKKTIRDVPALSDLRNRYLGRLNFRSEPVITAILDTFRDSIERQSGGRAFLDSLPEPKKNSQTVSLPLSPARLES